MINFNVYHLTLRRNITEHVQWCEFMATEHTQLTNISDDDQQLYIKGKENTVVDFPNFLCHTQYRKVSNTSNSMAEAMWVEANLLRTFDAYTILYSKCTARKCLTLKMKVKVTEYTILNGPTWWQIPTSIKVTLENVLAGFYHFRAKFDLENRGQGHDVLFTMAPSDIQYQLL